MMFARLRSQPKAHSRISRQETGQALPRIVRGGAGFTMVEVILSAALFALIVTGLAGVLMYGQESTAIAGQRFRAIMLADEALEAGRNMRDEDYTLLTDGPHGLRIRQRQWELFGASDQSGIFTRSFDNA